MSAFGSKVKFVCTPGDKTQFRHSACSLTISVGQLAHEGEKFAGLVDKVNRTFAACNIMVCDTLQRHNLWQNHKGQGASDLHDIAKLEGLKWFVRNCWAIDKLSIPHTVTYWDEWLMHPGFPAKQAFIAQAYQYDGYFKAAVETSLQGYLIRNQRNSAIKQADLARMRQQSLAYLLEESAVMLLIAEVRDYRFEIYPSQRIPALVYVHEHFIAPRYPGRLLHVTAKVESRKGPAQDVHKPCRANESLAFETIDGV